VRCRSVGGGLVVGRRGIVSIGFGRRMIEGGGEGVDKLSSVLEVW